MPNYKQLTRELAKPGVTMQLLWEEYVDQYLQTNLLYYQLTQFKNTLTSIPQTTLLAHFDSQWRRKSRS